MGSIGDYRKNSQHSFGSNGITGFLDLVTSLRIVQGLAFSFATMAYATFSCGRSLSKMSSLKAFKSGIATCPWLKLVLQQTIERPSQAKSSSARLNLPNCTQSGSSMAVANSAMVRDAPRAQSPDKSKILEIFLVSERTLRKETRNSQHQDPCWQC